MGPPPSESIAKLTASLRWIIYSDHIDDYAEMLCTTEYARLYAINQCAKHSSTHSACIKWAKKWNLVNHAHCAQAVYYAMSQQTKRQKTADSAMTEKQKEKHIEGYHDLPECRFDVMKVLFVNDAASFAEAKEVLLAEKECIGLDLECMLKQFPIENAPKLCQILQISTNNITVIFDLEAVPSKYSKYPLHSASSPSTAKAPAIDPEAFDDLIHGLLYDSSLLKIGMSFDADIKVLSKQYPYMKCLKCMVKNYLELEHMLTFMRSDTGIATFGVDKVMESRIREQLKKTNSKREGGLATVVRHVLKRRLNKREQLSNWSHRPLRLSQLEYAAIDSAIEIEVYHKFKEQHPDLIKRWVRDLCRF